MRPKDELVRAWLIKARNDLSLARHALAADPPLADGACFHAQQAVEKALKAVHVAREVEPPRTHVIELLMSRCGSLDPRLDAMGEQCVWLTEFAVAGRYPEAGCEPTSAQAREALAVAEQTYTIILETLPTEVHP